MIVPDAPDVTRQVTTEDGTGLVVDTWLPRAAGPEHPAGGASPPGVLLVHGLASNARLWDAVATVLRTCGHPVAALDQRGHGRSDKPDHGYDMATVSADLVVVLDALARSSGPQGAGRGAEGSPRPGQDHRGAWERPVVAGQSWGGNVVVDLAWRYPDRVAGIVCVDGGTIDLKARFSDLDAMRLALSPPVLEGMPADELEQRVRAAHPHWPEPAIVATLANMQRRPDGTVAPWLSLGHHLQVLDGMWEQRPLRQLAEVSVPTLFLMADDGAGTAWAADKRAGVDAALSVAARSRAQWFEPADHDVHAQFPEEVARAMHQFSMEIAAEIAGRTGTVP